MEDSNARTGQRDSELLQELVRLETSRLRHARFATFICIVLVAALAVMGVVYGPRLASLLENAEDTVVKISALTEDAEDLAKNVKTLTSDANHMVQNINRVVINNTKAVTDALEKLNSIDFERLNEAVNDLADTVAALSNLTSIFR